MTRIRAAGRNVAHHQHCYMRSLHTATQQTAGDHHVSSSSNAFVTRHSPSTLPPFNPQSLVNAGLSHLVDKKQLPIKVGALGVKDNICTTDLPTTCGSRALEGYMSPYDATVVSLLRNRAAKVTGKTNMDEFGMGSHSTHSHFGPVMQWHTDKDGNRVAYSAGGSSGGSALAVRNDECKMALGTDTGGSIRLPAAWCGVYGFKPSYGLVSRWGVIDYANSFDTVGWLSKSLNNIHRMHLSLCYPDKQDPTSLPASTVARIREVTEYKESDASRRQTIGVPVEYNIAELSPLVKQAWIDALELLKKSGYEVVSISLPTTKAALSAYYVLAPAEASSNLAKYDGVRYGTRAAGSDGQNSVLYSKTRSEGFGSEVRRRLLLGSYSLSADAIDNYFVQAQKVRRLVQKDFNNVFKAPHPLLQQSLESQLQSSFDWETSPGLTLEQPDSQARRVDLILCPTAPTPPPRLADIANQTPVESYINDVFTVPASMAGLPALNIPWGETDDPDPSTRVGLQVIGQFGHDQQVLSLGRTLKRLALQTE